jgi:hypothetical protein
MAIHADAAKQEGTKPRKGKGENGKFIDGKEIPR